MDVIVFINSEGGDGHYH